MKKADIRNEEFMKQLENIECTYIDSVITC